MLCNDVKQENTKPSSDLVSGPFCYVPLLNIRYGILQRCHPDSWVQVENQKF